MMDRQIHQPAADTLLPRPANTNVDPVIPRSATTRNGDLYPSIKGQGHQELFQDPANHQPSLAHLSTLSQHLSSSRNQTREMRDIQRDQPAADSRVMTDRQIHQPTADTLLPRPANTNVDPVIPRSETTSNVDLYPSIKGQGHRELFQDPANHQPSLAHLSTLSPTSAGPKYLPYDTHFTYCKLSISSCIHNFRSTLPEHYSVQSCMRSNTT